MQNRQKYIDMLRQIALFYMFFQHSVMALLNQNCNTGSIDLLYKIVPICPALFLFVSGFTINIIKTKYTENKKLTLRLIIRGLILILSGSLLFLLENGFQFPDLIISSNILNTIGWMLIISSFIMLIPYKEIILSIIIIIFILLNYFFEKNKLFIIPFNSGYEPLSPTIIFGFIGLLLGSILKKIETNKKATYIYILICGIIGTGLFTYFSIKYGIFKIFYNLQGRYEITRFFDSKYTLQYILRIDTHEYNFAKSLWNFRIENFFASLSAVLVLFSSGFFCEYLLRKLPKKIFLPARFAFVNYFYHLAVIAVFVLTTGYNSFNLIQFLIFLSALYISSYIVSFIAGIIKKQTRKTQDISLT